MSNPIVSFVIPCYKLAHLLPECVNSILRQTYQDFEILIMDDCSPDATAAVAALFQDTRVRYVRNCPNLGHLRNYNKGIAMSRGKYVWLISADDYLRRPYVLEKYVQLMEQHANVGYSFCPAIGSRNGRETELLKYSAFECHDLIVNGRKFLERLVEQNIVIAGSVLTRRECYQKISDFPLDAVWAGESVEMGWAGDWYLWCVFALSFDIAYFAEPMVCYREHDLNMTAAITDDESVARCAAADVAIPWMIKQKADERGLHDLSRKCLSALANEYARQGASKRYRSSELVLSIDKFEQSLQKSTTKQAEQNWIRARFYDGIGDRACRNRDFSSAMDYYLQALKNDRGLLKVYAKLALLPFGSLGTSVRKFIRSTVSTATVE
jgi:glycosyltransferase involved in cell wall biosynthesis